MNYKYNPSHRSSRRKELPQVEKNEGKQQVVKLLAGQFLEYYIFSLIFTISKAGTPSGVLTIFKFQRSEEVYSYFY